MEWQRHFKLWATPQMGCTCVFLNVGGNPVADATEEADPAGVGEACLAQDAIGIRDRKSVV